ncbi:AbrB/MazE/SpoVT family DNA-binding domain-containing protein [Sneathiella glossodoripedis]|uniref:AbrB/MazE/SpoVT family DNA-binding domain-containing protein n=1 Tax=Sneathiella glossodoripedis TaxID=418853 RepID=UPI0004716F27|nr:AbrB/MazE/SpoVT family DNA-binding domain-containing protein [Sneathiella glossodoripedis]
MVKKDLEPFETKLRKTGSAAGVTIPAEFLRHLGYEIGDTLRVKIEGDGLQVRKIDPEFDEFMALYEPIETHYRPSLKRLFK